MNKNILILAASTVVLGGAIAIGCGSSDSSTTSAATTSSSVAGTGGATASSTTGSATGGNSTTSTGTGMAPTCADYCTSVIANCGEMNEQYPTIAPATATDSCMGVCAAWGIGKTGDVTGDTVGCREYHAGAAAADANTHCAHAGPLGGAKAQCAPSDDPCDAFCEIATSVCSGANAQWTSTANCVTDCKTFKVPTTPYNDKDVDKDDLYCRMYHLSAAATNAGNATAHCPHIAKASAVCTGM